MPNEFLKTSSKLFLIIYIKINYFFYLSTKYPDACWYIIVEFAFFI